jgi:hypothetical protein
MTLETSPEKQGGVTSPTSLDPRPGSGPDLEPGGAPSPEPSEAVRRGRIVRAWSSLSGRRRTMLLFTPLVLLDVVVRLVNMGGAPQRIDDEGTYVAQAYAVEYFGQLAHYTYWYDHPPLGWIQIAVYTTLTDAFNREPNAVLAGREAMVVAAGASVLLLGVLARRLGLSRPAAAVAMALMALSPLAVQFQRTVYLDNVATPWALGAFVLALSPRRRLPAAAGAALCFAVAVLSKETYLLLGPILLWLQLRNSDPANRRYVLAVSGTLFAVACCGYVLLAVLKGELIPGPGHVSLLTGLSFQLFSRASSGSVFNGASVARRTVNIWLQLDTVLPVASVLAALGGLLVRRLRPIAAGYLFLLVFMLRPGYLPVPYVIALIPLAALLVAGAADAAVRRTRAGVRDGRTAVLRRRPLALPVALAAAIALVAATPAWGAQLRGLEEADLDAPMTAAEQWIETQMPKNNRIIVDDAMWVDLVRSGRPRNDVIWSYKVDTDPAVERLAPQGWRDYQWIVSTNSTRTSPPATGQLGLAEQHSTLAATFGTGTASVQVLHIDADGSTAPTAASLAQQAQAAGALAANTQVHLGSAALGPLRSNHVDERLLATLATLANSTPLSVTAFPAIPGEDAAGRARRQVLLTAPTPAALTAIKRFYAAQSGVFAPVHTQASGDTLLVTYGPTPPTDLFVTLARTP